MPNNQCNDRLRHLRVKRSDSEMERLAMIKLSCDLVDKARDRLGVGELIDNFEEAENDE